MFVFILKSLKATAVRAESKEQGEQVREKGGGHHAFGAGALLNPRTFEEKNLGRPQEIPELDPTWRRKPGSGDRRAARLGGEVRMRVNARVRRGKSGVAG